MPRIRVKSLPGYDLNRSFVTVNDKKYFEGENPANHLIYWQRFSDSAHGSVTNTGSPNDASSTLGSIVRIATNTLVSDLSPFPRDKVGNLRKTMRFSGNSSSFATQVSSNFIFGDGDGTTNDTAISVHMWIKADFQAAATTTLFSFSDAGFNQFISAGFDVSGNITWSILNGAIDSGGPVKIGRSYTAPSGAGWHHFVFTYDGTKTNSGLKFYINGVEQAGSSANNGTYTTLPNDQLQLMLGSAAYLLLPDRGIFEFAVYSGKVLSSDNVSALYDVTSGLSDETAPARTMLTGSGITSLPVRPYLHALDNATGSYPTIERWSADNSGNYPSFFDDTASIDFQAKGAALLFQRDGVPFGLEGNVVLGQQLSQDSQYLDRLLASPNTSPDLVLSTSQTSVLPGISDARVNFTPGQNFKPFVENNLLASDQIGKGNQFWSSGSIPSDIGIQGFEQPLWSKTKIEIDINPAQNTEVFYSTGTNPHSSPFASRGLGLAAGVNSGITYYNFSKREFEVIGDLTSGSFIDIYQNKLDLVTGSMQAFVNRSETDQRSRYVDSSISSVKDAEGSAGSFIYEKIGGLSSLAGFPQAPKFNATSSQLFDVSSLISTPFIVEKIVYEFSASFPELGIQDRPVKPVSSFGSSGEVIDFGPIVYNFFVMNQYQHNWNRKISYDQIFFDDIDLTSKYEFDLTTGSIKDVVFAGQVSQFSLGDTADGTLAGTLNSYQTARWWDDKKYLRDLNIIEEGVDNAKPGFSGGLTGSFVLSGNINQPTFSGISGLHRGLFQDKDDATYRNYSMGSRTPSAKTGKAMQQYVKSLGGRTNIAGANEGGEISSPRNLVGSVIGKGLVGMPSDYTDILFGQDPGGYNSNSSVPSPYILFPNDKLIFGWANQSFSAQGDSFESYKGSGVGTKGYPLNGDTERVAHDSRLNILPGKGKIVLYGSLMRQGKEFHQSTNQLLTSDAIHEDVRSNQNPMGQSDVLDQLEAQYYFLYSGSYIDRAFGDFDPRSEKSPIQRLSIQPNSVVGGLAGVTGSILKGVRLSDADERYFDSLVPEPDKIAKINENSFRLASGTDDFFGPNDDVAFYIMGGTASGFSLGTANPDQTWPRAFPFEARYGGSDSKTAPRTARPLSVVPDKTILGTTLTERRKKRVGNFSLMFAQQRPLWGGAASDSIIAVLARAIDSSPFQAVPDSQVKFLKGFYGFGDGGEFNLPIMTGENSVQTSTFVGYGYNNLNIRGFKFGLISALPAYSSMVYRHDRYGQLRDMLEQRTYTVSQPIEYSNLSQDSLTGLPSTLGQARGGQRNGPVSIDFFKVVGDSPQTAQRVPLTSKGSSSDFADIRAAVGGNIRGVWDSRCNIDAFSRVVKPFVDADPDISTPGLENLDLNTQQTDILNALNRGGEIAFDLGDFNIT